MTTCEIASAINSANGNGVQIDCDDVTGKKYAYEDGGVVFIGYKDDEIMYEPIDRKYYANDKEFDSLEEAQKFLDSGGVNEDLRGAYERGLFKGGGWILVDADTERKLGEYATESEASEMMYEYEGNAMLVQKSVWDKLPPNPNRHSPAFNFKQGGGIKDYNSLIGKYVNIYSMGVSLPTEHQIKDVQVSGESFRYRYVTLKFDLGIAPILLDEATAFMNNEIIYVNNNKEEFGIQLIPNQFKEGGGVDSIKIGDEVIWKGNPYLLTNITSSTQGGFYNKNYYLSSNKVGVSDAILDSLKNVEKVKFEGGGDVRDFSWYQDFKKQELKKGTEHEMEHIDTIKKFKKEGVSDKEVAEAIAKDHLEEDENYYIELDKMESSRKLSEALNDFVKHKGYRKNSRKYNLGGSMMESKEPVHLKFTEDFNGVIRTKDGKYVSESLFPKGKVYKFTFLFNDGKTTALEFGNTGAYILAPNEIINVVGFNEEMYDKGGSIKPYQSVNLDSNDKSILEMLRNIEDRNATSKQREKLASFKGTNVVNELSSKMIQKIYGILFKNHNVDNKILNLYLSNIGVGNILLFAPSFLHKTMVSFDEHNQFSQVEKDIADIVTQGARAFLYNDIEMKEMDAIIHVYANPNPEVDTLCATFFKTDKKAIALGVCEFTSRQRLYDFQESIRVNQGSMAQNQMMSFAKSNEYFIVNEGISQEGEYTLIYTMTKF
jgi:hypothetical protein